MTSEMTITTRTVQKSGVLALPLSIFLTLLAVDAVTGVRKRVETLVRDLVPTVVALSKRLGRAIETAKRFIEVPEKTPFLAGEEKCLLSLHRIGALICHVERIGAQVSVGALLSRSELFVVMTELLQDPLALFHKPFLEMIEILFRHCLRLLGGGRCCHLYYPL